MELFLIRHAHAIDSAPEGDDAARPLSGKGRRRFEQSVDGLAHLGVRFDLVLHSPWLRAVETADLLEPLLEGEMRVTPRLSQAPARALLDEFDTHDGARVAAVGHEPWLSELLAWLVLEDLDASQRFRFEKGGVAWLNGSPTPGGMSLHALLTPKVLRSLA
jgi:phosphohistidine phosphatase